METGTARQELRSLGAAHLDPSKGVRDDTSTLLSLAEYDAILVQFSGGKDSIACVLEVLRQMDGQGVPRDRLELWHQCIDGDPRRNGPGLMDWPVTEAYCQAFAEAMGLRIYFQWKEGGFEGEMERNDQPTGRTGFMMEDGSVMYCGGKGPRNTRQMFPQVCADLSKRWCSAYLKIDVAAAAIRNLPRFKHPGVKLLVVTGERWEESTSRSRYAWVEKHRATTQKRRVDQWRPVLDWNEGLVWETLRDAGVNAHPCYGFGYSRASCAMCIFGGSHEWATIQALDPALFERVAEKEERFGKTIHRTLSVREQAAKGESMVAEDMMTEAHQHLMGHRFEGTILTDPASWMLPSGAFRHTAGPC